MNIDVSPNSGFTGAYDSVNNAAAGNPIMIIALFVIILFYYLLFSSLSPIGEGVATTAAPKSVGITFLEIVMWGLFIFLVMINGIQYFYGVDVKAGIKNLFQGTPEIDLTITPETEDSNLTAGVPELSTTEVYNIPGNKYTYTDAEAVCKAYGGRLASYGEIESAYEDGGEWCNYGWSKDQLALYPTQKNTWKNLQKIKAHKHDCGRPGINGGYIANPNVKFGVNCFGHKPVIRRKKINGNTEEPFNYDNWSQT